MALVRITNVGFSGDALTISGTVDGVPVSATAWKSHIDSLATAALKKAYLRLQLKLTAQGPASPIDIPTLADSIAVET